MDRCLRSSTGRITRGTLVAALLVVVTPRVVPAGGDGYAAESADARAAAEAFLDAAGGRDAWRGVRSIRLLAVNRSPDVALPFVFEVALDLVEPRSMTRVSGQDMDRLRAYAGASGWGIKEGPTGPASYTFPEERLRQERVLWAGAFSRNLRRLAAGDPGLVVRAGTEGRLELADADGTLCAWFRLDAHGRATRFGFPGDDVGLELGGYADYGPRRIPSLGTTPEGVRFETLSVRVSDRPLDVPSAPPADLSTEMPR